MSAQPSLALAIAPNWLAGLLDVSSDDATAFLVRRYGVSATAALIVVAIAISRQAAPQPAALLAFATWFGVQAVVAILGIVAGTVGGLAWLAAAADPLIAAWFFAVAGRVDINASPASRAQRSADLTV